MPNPPIIHRKPDRRSWIKNLPFDAAEAEQIGQSPECTQEVIHRWLRTPVQSDGKMQVPTQEQVAARCLREFSDFGCKLTLGSLTEAISQWRPWYESKQMFRSLSVKADAFEEQLRAEFPNATPETIAAFGQKLFTTMATASGDVKTFQGLEHLRLAKETAETNAALEQAKLTLLQRKVGQKDEAIKLARERFETEIAEKMLSEELRAKAAAINASDLSNADKIAAMRAAAFAEVDAMQKSGKVVLPE